MRDTVQLVLGIVSCAIFEVVGLIEGIIYLTKSDEQLVAEYVVSQK